jgi:glycosyltransferase involved in cell wall biosynthesis
MPSPSDISGIHLASRCRQQFLTAVISTRNRGNSLEPTVRSVLANTHSNSELLIIDQSSNLDTAAAVAPFLAEHRVRYITSDTVDLGRSHNIALREARGEILVITDDDCEVPPDWLEKMAAPFGLDPRIAVVFCNVGSSPPRHECGVYPGVPAPW